MAIVVAPLGNFGPAHVSGSFISAGFFKITGADGEGTSAAISIPGFSRIDGAIIQALDDGNNIVTQDADVTWSGNILTIADGSSFDLSADGDAIYAVVWGLANV